MSLDALPADTVVDRDAATVSFGATMRYGDLAAVLADEGLALHNLASLPHISVAGAVATATHGSGDAQQQPGHRGRRARDGDLGGRHRDGDARGTRTSTGWSSDSVRLAP